jgi:hypothetical protein
LAGLGAGLGDVLGRRTECTCRAFRPCS